MKIRPVASLLTLIFLLCGCANDTLSWAPAELPAHRVSLELSPDYPRETLLLVSLDDGSVIMQTIQSNADVCFKRNSDSATTCLTQGAPVFDPVTDAVIGYETIEDHIDLVASSD